MVKNNRPVVVGIFILLGIVILFLTLFTIGGQKETFVKSFTVKAIFNDVGGLSVGANIWFSGVKVGTVKKIGFYGNSQVEVTMNIEKDAESHIRKDAKAKIGSDGFIGNKIVVIYGGTPAYPPVQKDDLLKVEDGISTDDMLATLQANNKNLLAITNDFKSISGKMNSGKGSLGSLLNDPSFAVNLNKTVGHLQEMASNLKTVSENSMTTMKNFEEFSGKINRPGNSINDFASDTLVYNRIVGTVTQLQSASASVNKFTANLRMVSEKMNRKDNTVGVLLNDSASATSIKMTLKNLETGSKKLDEDLEAIQHNFLFRGFFKKKEKEKNKAD
ncbi:MULTISPECIES: MlaD family protein [unclassified Arcicella]|uniref:MlaD family protein n=1 Tax=unclassified Arcicella TaxID=2644986 RepID=UPI00285CF80A|nr:MULTISPECIES: MlaD family protein [unclassified Arcicella]MDR6560945.1 phospholipid/cholesterol/gamma-HCH transport system substrate-binding protein [Arcicella sp. BE51]MDR6810829.1 phospholipid/cholesterol/gamma-HCH transport system substrate-binding protein [Arcicella sp. BE140]MDR6822179.1 phospholipid/cholesterol/gamma-HCH transport system substrate-binding protein [Arcicella sp. BE139]